MDKETQDKINKFFEENKKYRKHKAKKIRGVWTGKKKQVEKDMDNKFEIIRESKIYEEESGLLEEDKI